MITWAKRQFVQYREQISYLFFGGLATLLNLVLAVVFRWMGFPTFWNTLLDNLVCILFAYLTNRTWVFCSQVKGWKAVQEFAAFIGCRLGTLVLDVALMWLGVDLLGQLVAESWQDGWFVLVKVVTQVLVIAGNYLFSKWIIFRR